MHKYADNFVQDTVILLTNHYGAGSDKGISLSTNSENFGSSKEICWELFLVLSRILAETNSLSIKVSCSKTKIPS